MDQEIRNFHTVEEKSNILYVYSDVCGKINSSNLPHKAVCGNIFFLKKEMIHFWNRKVAEY